MNKIVEYLFSVPKSFYVSLKYFSLKDAIRLPILVRYNTLLLELKGNIVNVGGGQIRSVKSRLW